MAARLRRLALAALWILALQFAAYAWILARPPAPAPGRRYGLVAVFGGDPERVRLGLSLARAGAASAFVVSDTDRPGLSRYILRYGGAGGARLLLEPYARTTDQNARLVARLARREGLGSVILVTSWIHRPRAYLLLRLGLAGSGIQAVLLSAGPRPAWRDLPGEFLLEYAKWWGSLGRWAKSGLRRSGLLFWETPRMVD